MAEETKKPLLIKRVYHEKCPGCKLDQIIETRRGVPYLEFFRVWLIMLSNSLPISSLFPFVYFMVKDFHIAKTEENVSFYAGFVGASFMLGRAFSSVPWGIAADRYGRKPVMYIGTLSVIVFNTLFGLATNYWMAISTRLLLGLFNGMLGTMRAHVVELGGREHEALGMSLVTAAWGVGLIIGPAIGGFLAQPAEKYPNLISKDSVFGRFPYLLPCLCISFFAVVAFFVSLFVPETLHFHGKEDGENRNDINEDIEERGTKLAPSSDRSLLKNWPLISSIILLCIFLFHCTIFDEAFPLWSESERKYGGLSFSTTDVGEVLAISGFSLFIFQITLYPMINKALGVLMVIRLAAVLTVPLLTCYPFFSNFKSWRLKLILNCASLLKNIFNVSIITGLNLLQNNAVPQDQRGAANGISTTAQSIFQAAGPATAGTLLSWVQKRLHASFLPGDHLLFFLLNVVELIGLVLTFKPFFTIPSHRPLK